ncbi:MAG: hypothetical protein JSW12_22795 [Deltaproteobacteria bacterium]|nr:MAG: hypothetical protein JSW12_22795 [Deltaproteobacteria bacterium]
MPLVFHSLTHGPIASGFFNIETDLLLLENYFFFAPCFFTMVKQISGKQSHESNDIDLAGYFIDQPTDIGNLTGAIQGTELSRFIGHVYQMFPFPRNPEEFKQKPHGGANRSVVEELLSRRARSTQIPVLVEEGAQRVSIAQFIFSKEVFRELAAYVWHGGMPGWQDNMRPDYVIEMKETIRENRSPLFAGFEL